MHWDQHKVVDCSVCEQSAADNLATIVNGDGEQWNPSPSWSQPERMWLIDPLPGDTGPDKGTTFRKILIKSIARDLAVVTDACRNSVGKLANCAEKHRRAGAAGPVTARTAEKSGIIRVTNHVSRTVDGVTGENDNGVNESASRRRQCHRCARAVGPKRGMAFTSACRSVADDVAGSIDVGGYAERKAHCSTRR